MSRSDLEEDEEYLRVGKICIEMAFEHIADEVQRISNDTGKPLSRASMAAKWLYHDLLRTCCLGGHPETPKRAPRPTRIYVMESTEKKDTSRSLISPDTLDKLEFFWTVESRLVDSLGFISRDLGRELSLFEFLNALAPDYGELQFSPIIPDAHHFSEDIVQRHCPQAVQFSRRYQQTAIKWIAGSGLPGEGRSGELKCDKLFFERVRVESERQGMIAQAVFSSSKPIRIAELSGDEKKIEAVVQQAVS